MINIDMVKTYIEQIDNRIIFFEKSVEYYFGSTNIDPHFFKRPRNWSSVGRKSFVTIKQIDDSIRVSLRIPESKKNIFPKFEFISWIFQEGYPCWGCDVYVDAVDKMDIAKLFILYAVKLNDKKEKLYKINSSRKDGEELVVVEGMEFEKKMMSKVRNSKVTKERKAFDDYTCQVCGFSYESVMEVHHLIPVSMGKRSTNLNDLITLCPTCHRIAHTKGNKKVYSIQDVQMILNRRGALRQGGSPDLFEKLQS